MNILLLKQAALFSALIGGIIGIVTLIPYIGNITFLALILFLSAIIIVYFKNTIFLHISQYFFVDFNIFIFHSNCLLG